MGKFVTTSQMKEFLLIDARIGAHDEFQELINRLTDGGIAGKRDDIVRRAQAKRLWDIGVGRELGVKKFKDYLATIPEVPEELLKDDAEFPLLVLVELRIGLSRLCVLGNIKFDGNDDTFVAYDARCAEFTQPTWIRVQNGRKNRNRKVVDCRTGFVGIEIGLTALQGVCAYLHHPTVISELNDNPDGHAMDLPGSVLRGDRGCAAYLVLWKGRAELNRHWDGYGARCGSASRRECKN